MQPGYLPPLSENDEVGSDIEGASLHCPSKYVELVRVTPYFAPSAQGEKLTVTYNIRGMQSEVVRLKVTDRNKKVVLDRELTSQEKQDPWPFMLKSITWDGQTEPGTYIDLLGSPFSVELSPNAKTMNFRVICVKLDILLAPWDPEEKFTPTHAPQEFREYPKWVRFKLNHLGYFAGPVNKNLGQYEAIARKRYRATHKDLLKFYYNDYDTFSIEDAKQFRNTLEMDKSGRPYLTRSARLGRQQLQAGDDLKLPQENEKLRIHVEALPWMVKSRVEQVEQVEQVDELVNQYNHSEARNPVTRRDQEQLRLNRPLIPIEAVLYLKGSDDQPKLAPKGLGEVQINWSHTEPQEDLANQFDDKPEVCSYPRRYIEKCLKLHNGRIGQTNNNCHSAFGGIREASLPFLAGTYYPPYNAYVNNQIMETKTYTGQIVESVVYEKRRARAGLYFQPSTIAGDTYRIKAELVRANLDPEQQAVCQETNPIQVWRYAKVAAVVDWPKRDDLSTCWEQVKEQYQKAYFDLDVASIAHLPIGKVLKNKEYTDWITTGIAQVPEMNTIVSNKLTTHGMVSLKIEDKENIDAYMESFHSKILSDNSLDNLWKVLHTNVRNLHPDGIIFVTFRFGSDNLQHSYVSNSLPNGAILIDKNTPGKLYHIISHEMAHCFWLNHGRHTLRNQKNFPGSEMAKEHDPSDHNCIMDYTNENDTAHPHRKAATYMPRFCGKCNLKLRGWEVTNDALPMDLPRVVSCDWITV